MTTCTVGASGNQNNDKDMITNLTNCCLPHNVTEAKGRIDFALLTIREDEFSAVLQRFPPAAILTGLRQYNLSTLRTINGRNYLVATVRCIEQGNGEAQDAARDVIEDLAPQWLIVIGIAGGVPADEFTLGDVVVSTRIYDFSVEAVIQDAATEYAPAGGGLHKAVTSRVANLRALQGHLRNWNCKDAISITRPVPKLNSKLFYGDTAWKQKVRASLERHFSTERMPLVAAGPIASSDRLIKDTERLKVFQRLARNILAVEMESAGVYRTARGRHTEVPILAIRGISDIVGYKRDSSWTEYACHSAASFAHAFLQTEPIPPIGDDKRCDLRENDTQLRTDTYSSTYNEGSSSAFNPALWEPIFTSELESLKDFYISPEPVFQRVAATRFTGREWLLAKLDSFLSDPKRKCGAFVLVGEAGVGKTSILAHLVRTRQYPHVFLEQCRGEIGAHAAIRSLAVQLIAKYKLASIVTRAGLEGLLPSPSVLLYRLMQEAAKTLENGHPLVIVCDALDEAVSSEDANVLSLPEVLPDGVYLILSQQPVPLRMTCHYSVLVHELNPNCQNNRSDIIRFINQGEIRKLLEPDPKKPDPIQNKGIDSLLQRTGGLWVYIDYVLRELTLTDQAFNLEALPVGLVAYFAEFFSRWKLRTAAQGLSREWHSPRLAVVATLAVAQEPLDIKQITEWVSPHKAEVTIFEFKIQNLLNSELRPIITTRVDIRKEVKYLLYHSTIRDFICGEIENANLLPEYQVLAKDLSRAVLEAHRRLAKSLATWQRDTLESVPNLPYAHRYLAFHLAKAGMYYELRHLVFSDWWPIARYAEDRNYAGYIRDLQQLWTLAETPSTFSACDQVRAAFLTAKITSVVTNFSAEAMLELLSSGKWNAATAVAHIAQLPNDEAGEIAKAQAIGLLWPMLPPTWQTEAANVGYALQTDGGKKYFIGAMRLHASEGSFLDKLITLAESISGNLNKVHAIGAIVNLVSLQKRNQLIEKALKSANIIESSWVRIQALVPIALRVDAVQRREIFSQALEIARKIPEQALRARCYSYMLSSLPAESNSRLIAEAFREALQIEDGSFRAHVLLELLPVLQPKQREKALSESLTQLRAVRSEWRRFELTQVLIDSMEPAKLEQFTELVDLFEDSIMRIKLCVLFAKSAKETTKAQLLSKAFTLIESMPKSSKRITAIKQVLPLANVEQRAKFADELRVEPRSRTEANSLLRLLKTYWLNASQDCQNFVLKKIAASRPDYAEKWSYKLKTKDDIDEQGELKRWISDWMSKAEDIKLTGDAWALESARIMEILSEADPDRRGLLAAKFAPMSILIDQESRFISWIIQMEDMFIREAAIGIMLGNSDEKTRLVLARNLVARLNEVFGDAARAGALIAVGSQLDNLAWELIQKVLRTIRLGSILAHCIVQISKYFLQKKLMALSEEAQQISDPWSRAWAFAAITSKLTGDTQTHMRSLTIASMKDEGHPEDLPDLTCAYLELAGVSEGDAQRDLFLSALDLELKPQGSRSQIHEKLLARIVAKWSTYGFAGVDPKTILARILHSVAKVRAMEMEKCIEAIMPLVLAVSSKSSIDEITLWLTDLLTFRIGTHEDSMPQAGTV